MKTKTKNESQICWKFSRDLALSVAHLWDAPQLVINSLRTGRRSTEILAWHMANDGVRTSHGDSRLAAEAAAAATAGDSTGRDAASRVASIMVMLMHDDSIMDHEESCDTDISNENDIIEKLSIRLGDLARAREIIRGPELS